MFWNDEGANGGGGGASGFTPQQDAWARNRGVSAMLTSMGGTLMGMGQGGMAPQQQAAMRAAGLSRLGQDAMRGQEATDQGYQMIQQRQQQATQSQLARARLNQMQQQLLIGQRFASMLGTPGDAPAVPPGGGGGVPQAVPPGGGGGGGVPQAVPPGGGGGGGGGGVPQAAPPAGVAPQVALPDDLVARMVHMEAGGEGPEGMAAVARVIRNRARLTGSDPSAVVTAPGQFEPWGNAERRRRLLAMQPQEYAAAAQAWAGAQDDNTPDPTGGATHFLNPALVRQRGGAQPAWAPEGQGQPVGRHVFYSRPGDFRQGQYGPGRVSVAQGGGAAGSVAAAAPLTDDQRALAAGGGAPAPAAAAQPGGGAPPNNARPSGNTIQNMPQEMRQMAAMRAAAGDLDGASQIVSQWLTRAPPQVQMTEVGGRRREVLPDGALGRDYGPVAEQQPRMGLDDLVGMGVPPQQARMIGSLSTRAEQDQAVRAYATREQPRPNEQEDILRREFQGLPPVTRYAQSLPLFETINSTVDRIRRATAAGGTDQLAELDLVIGIANLFDPGSVVREGEVANVIRTQGLTGDVQRALGYATSGQRLPVAVLNQVVGSADDRMQSYRRAVEPYERAYRRTAEGRGLNAENVLLDLGDPVARRNERAAENPVPPPRASNRLERPSGATDAEIANRIRALYRDPAMRRSMATAAGINPSLVE